MTRGTNAGRQTTLREQVTLSGIGIHSGSPVTLTLHPAEPDTGIVFLRCGAGGCGTRRPMMRQSAAASPASCGHPVDRRAAIDSLESRYSGKSFEARC